MKLQSLFLSVFILISTFANAQFFPKNQAQADSLYATNVKKTRINGVYIPKNLDEAFEELKALSTPEATRKFSLGSEETVAKKLFYGIGRWMSFNWNFEGGSRFTKHLADLGVYRNDDMIDFMIRVYHRHLNKKPLNTADLAEVYQRAWNEEKRLKSKDGELISSKKIEQPK